MHVIIRRGPGRPRVRRRAHDELRGAGQDGASDYPPERAAQICGIDADTIRDVARLWGAADAAIIFWGMGISQHTTGTDNARCLIALCSITGNVGRPGTGLHPLRGQNNVQGASDAGLIPMMYPDYQPVDQPRRARALRVGVGRASSIPNPGLTVTEIIAAALQGGVRGMYMMGENPFLSDPNVNKVRKALAALEFLVVQDIFLTETAEFADVVLPATTYLEKRARTRTPTGACRSAARRSTRRARRARTGRSSATSPPASATRWATSSPRRSSTSWSR